MWLDVMQALIKPKILGAALLAFGSAANAYFPFQTDDTDTQGTGGNQIEIDYIYNESETVEFSQDGQSTTNSGTSNAFAFTYTLGVAPNIDLFIGNSLQSSPAFGWQNIEIGAKWVFTGDQEKNWSFALKPVVTLPVSSASQNAGLGSAQTNGGLTLVGSYLTDLYQVHINLGYATNRLQNTPDTSPQRASIWSASIAPVWLINEKWLLGLDFGIQTNAQYNTNYAGYAQIGVSYAPIPNLQLGLGIVTSSDLGDRDNTRSTSVTAGITYQF